MLIKTQLNECTDICDIVEKYNKNIKNKWDLWLEHKSRFNKSGKQGIIGLLKFKENESEVIYKISQYINYLVQHEHCVMNGLNDISEYCPHFCKSVGIISCDIDPQYRKNDNPFETKVKYPIEKNVLLMEHIKDGCRFYNYIKSPLIKDNVIYSTIKQVLMGISLAQKKKEFSHYDLHSFNIMIKKCDKDIVFLYVLDENTQFIVPTNGYYPVIIDFGFSYIKDMEDGPLWPSMAHTNVGFMSDRFDWVADPKLFLVTVSSEIKDTRKGNKSIKFRNIVKNVFGNLNIDFDSGWDKMDKLGAMDYVSEMLSEYSIKESKVFTKYEHYSFDLIQSLIILPLEKKKYDNMHISYQAFIREFIKIENVISDPYYNLYILKGLIDIAREVRSDYLCISTRQNAVKHFRIGLHEKINYVTSWCIPKNIKYELMLCSLLEFSLKMEGYLYHIVNDIMNKKKINYDKLPVKSIDQIYGAIEVNIPDDYVYNDNTKIFIFDSVQQKTSVIKINENKLDELNNTHPLGRGTYIYNLYTK